MVQGRPDDWAIAHPSMAQLVVEVSVSSLAVDESKGGIYAEAGVLEYWLVRPDERAVDVYRKPGAEGYAFKTTLLEQDTLRCASIPGIAILVSEILPPAASSKGSEA